MTRNDGNHLEECINSIIQNTRHPHCIIIIDNHSSDALSIQLADSFAKKHPDKIRVIKNKSNKWVIGLNKAIHAELDESDPLFVLTDGDIVVKKPDELSGECWLSSLIQTMSKNPWIGKLGLSIDLSNIKNMPSMESIFIGEKIFYQQSLTPDIFLAQVDTTIAIYRSDLFIHNKPFFYPGHNSYIKPHYHVGRLKKHSCIHLGWENYDQPLAQSQIDEKIFCFTKYCGYINKITLAKASLSARTFNKLSPIFRLYWGIKLFFQWAIYLKNKKVIYQNELLQRSKSKY